MNLIRLKLILGLFIICLGCLEVEPGLDLSVNRNNYFNVIELKNNADVEYTKCRLIANKNWTFSEINIAKKSDMLLSPANFTSKDGVTLNSEEIINSLEIFCKQGYYGGSFNE